jgi:predicted esterase
MPSLSFGLTNKVLLLLITTFLVTGSFAMSSTAKRGALIFLHGLGDSPAGWSQLEYSLPGMKSRLKDIAYVFPPAPTIPITINGGSRMPGWFDLYDWPIGVGSKDDKDGMLAGVEAIQAEVAKLNDQGIPSEKIVVGGFSQGGAVALLAAYRSDVKFAGCAGLSAWLTLPGELKISDEAKQTPLFWGHGRMDDKVLFPQQKFGVDKLRGEGVTVTDEAYDMGHESHPDEMQKLADFVDESIFGGEEDQEL